MTIQIPVRPVESPSEAGERTASAERRQWVSLPETFSPIIVTRQETERALGEICASLPALQGKEEEVKARFDKEAEAWGGVDKKGGFALCYFLCVYQRFSRWHGDEKNRELEAVLDSFHSGEKGSIKSSGLSEKSVKWLNQGQSRVELTNRGGRLLGGLIVGYLAADRSLAQYGPRNEPVPKDLLLEKGKYIKAGACVYGSLAPEFNKLGVEDISGVLRSVSKVLGVWEVPKP